MFIPHPNEDHDDDDDDLDMAASDNVPGSELPNTEDGDGRIPPTVTAPTRSQPQRRRRGSLTSDVTVAGGAIEQTCEKLTVNSNKRFKEQMVETVRHNQVMENTNVERLSCEKNRLKWEMDKYAKTESLELASADLRLKSQMLDEYTKRKNQGLSDEVIVAIMPQLQPIVEAMQK
jgi:hypothetical protein